MFFEPSAKIIVDSISPEGFRLTTMEVTHHRWVLAEVNTHRVFSRNSASSRAIPFDKQLKRVTDYPVYPIEFGENQSGMQAFKLLDPERVRQAKAYIDDLREYTVDIATKMAKELKLHKQVVNRYLEPFLPHTGVITATEWDGFFWQRCHKDAQPEFRAPAMMMQYAYYTSKPQELTYGQWHLPYLDFDTWSDIFKGSPMLNSSDYIETLKKVSAARCARTSYLTQDGKRDYHEDINLYERLINADVLHASPLEHVATPASQEIYKLNNFKGWNQFRHEIEANLNKGKFIPNHPLLTQET